MTTRRQHNHHRPRVQWGQPIHAGWFAFCDCGWFTNSPIWHVALIRALFHSESLTS